MGKLLGRDSVVGQPHLAMFDNLEFCGKGFNIQIEGMTAEMRQSVYTAIRKDDSLLHSHYFFQGDAGNDKDGYWMMIEFWTGNKSEIKKTCQVIAKALAVDYSQIVDVEKVLPEDLAV
ncbi:hypothetical protein [Aeromonas sp. MrichA-1]|uniref:hypothetical protein n=1 Tax=Aeromonas sp. MrichA-1 TaxID=2823362 RepID=UPI001B326BB8|nr:hypothetical protein [Aeromonas sp. MrichA-1]MBP4081913.1 hypothetical protein [Aeromonas sp. MrichA-1]